MTMRIGPREHGPTNVLQVTFVFSPEGDLTAASGYQRDREGTTWGQWRQQASGNLGGRQLVTQVLEYLSEVIATIDTPA